jgi:hypothetical protein
MKLKSLLVAALMLAVGSAAMAGTKAPVKKHAHKKVHVVKHHHKAKHKKVAAA